MNENLHMKMVSIYLIIKSFIYLKTRVTEKGEKERDLPDSWFTPQVASMIGAGPGCSSQEPVIPSRFSHMSTGTQILGLIVLLSQVC